MQAWYDDAIEVIAALPILEEIGEALWRPRIKKKYRIQEDEVAQYLELIAAGAIIVAVTGKDEAIPRSGTMTFKSQQQLRAKPRTW